MHAQEHVLGEIFGPSRVAERARDDAEHQPPVAADQFRKRLVAAVSAQADEIVVCQIGHAPAAVRAGESSMAPRHGLVRLRPLADCFTRD